jgi:diguanylate cyclase (GGDEF)-like protein
MQRADERLGVRAVDASSDDPLAIGAFRRRLVRVVVATVVVLTLTATALSIRLTDTVSREREAAVLAARLGDPTAGERASAEALAALDAASIRQFSSTTTDGGTLRWGFTDGPRVQVWAARTGPDGAPRLLSVESPPTTPEMQQTLLIRLGTGSAILAWLTFWAGLLVTQRTTERLQASARQLLHAWTHDARTGLQNRDRLASSIDGMPPDHPGAMICIAVADLGQQHDTLGAEHTDAVLDEIVARTLATLRGDAQVARVATDAIAVWAPDLTGQDALDHAERLRQVIHTPIETSAARVLPTPRLGVALRPEHGTSGAALLSRAGRASRSATAAAGGVAAYRATMDAEHKRHLWLRPLLQEAIQQGTLELHYQPKIDAGTLQIRSVEALARWSIPGHGPVRPDHFIAVAEQSGLIIDLTLLLLERALAQAERLSTLGYECPIALNVSALCLGSSNVVDALLIGLTKRDLPIHALELEITETAALADGVAALELLEKLRRHGLRIAMDDFGTGQSSLAQLSSMPIDEVKIDQAFIRPLDADAPADAPGWRLVAGIIQLATTQGCTTTAEGVEDAAVGHRLRDLGCGTLQGWAYSKAIPAGELEALLQAQLEAQTDATPPTYLSDRSSA